MLKRSITGWTALLILCGTLGSSAGCSKDIEVDNLLGRVTSIGPVYKQEDGRYTVHFSVYDRDGDPTDVVAEYRFGEGQAWQRIPACSATQAEDCQLIGGLEALGTDPSGSVQHQVAWRAPDALVGRDIELRMRATTDPDRGVVSTIRLER